MIPKNKDIEPRYDQLAFSEEQLANRLQTVVSPLDADDEGVKINQDAYFHLGTLEPGDLAFKPKLNQQGIFVFNLEVKSR